MGEESGYVERSAFPRRIMPRLQEQPPDRLSHDEIEHILTVPEPWAFTIRFGLGTGLRWGELVRAQAAHVEGDMLRVTHTKSRRQRRIPLSPSLLREIRSHVGRLVPYAERSCGSFNRDVRRYSGVHRFHVHQLRHTMACTWLEAGGSLAALQQILGHASIVTTQRYARLSDDAVLAEARRLHGGVEDRVEGGLHLTRDMRAKTAVLQQLAP